MSLKIPPLFLLVLFAFAAWALSNVSLALDFAPWLRWSLLLVYGGVGIIFAVAGVREFRRCNTTVDPTKPNNTSALVTSGIYSVTRNPMYVGMAMWLLGWSGFLASPVAMMLVLVFVWYLTRFQIKPEEQVLTQLFGDEFKRYSAAVRRWL
ncbi:isoprenylcysteine carboxylmethyltransferase family protein [Shewanella sp. SNU WT4]|uniref:methyltransferase family protein n=1 Tax=Shewanella sp. SNU WT4 TaxID=2590015 RepID=UPI00112E16E9|nr:isoprenylcysteine carboxylmethyltransferase family protein [Shewanella sp. SNU WT4]QDF65597.1 isoprenylcysteine carboxylmethyltransferase family protein [Shewanella sp. SNU WT4]